MKSVSSRTAHQTFPRVVAFGGDAGLRRALSGLTTAHRPSGASDVRDQLTAVVNGHDASSSAGGTDPSARDNAARLTPTVDEIALRAEFEDETLRRRLRVTAPARPDPELLKRIINADVIVVGPGSLYSAILPALLVGGVASTVSGLTAVRIYVANLLTEPGETDDFTVADCLEVIRVHVRANLFDYVLVNRWPSDLRAADISGVSGEQPMARGQIDDRDLVVVEEDLAERDAQGRASHSPVKLANAILRIAQRDRRRSPTRVMPGVAGTGAVAGPLTTKAAAHTSYERMITSPTSFWMAVREPFMRHDLTREDVREVVRRGLERTSGSYRLLAELFNLAPTDYERFLTFLQEYDCEVCVLPFSSIQRNDPTAIERVV
jgi:2-phospho-L-lactate transferase/gluconeogenesis factor (CofD/UPF0052 family)